MIRNLEDEIQLSSKMHNEHVVKLLGACLGNKDNVCLIMELVEGGNLSKRIHNKSLRRLDYLEVLQVRNLADELYSTLDILEPEQSIWRACFCACSPGVNIECESAF